MKVTSLYRLVVHCREGYTVLSDPVEVNEETLKELTDLAANFTSYSTFFTTRNGDEVYFNPAHIISIEVSKVRDNEVFNQRL